MRIIATAVMLLLVFVSCGTQNSKPDYEINSIYINFDEELSYAQKTLLKNEANQAINLFPKHVIDSLEGLNIAFLNDHECFENERNIVGCFRYLEYTILIKVPQNAYSTLFLEGTIVHEIAHAIDYRISWFNPSTFEKLYAQNSNRPSKYAGTNAREDFAESVKAFVVSNNHLEKCCTKRHNFIEKHIFEKDVYNLHVKYADTAKPSKAEIAALILFALASLAGVLLLTIQFINWLRKKTSSTLDLIFNDIMLILMGLALLLLLLELVGKIPKSLILF